ncbi:hypothetical protein BCR34DRAFT_200164 [Clohesyomyces aquaticus]|uniref:Uncharacterized protein n=1 Tax=Clohesyomyces aquaticus TaxID=1231657 RepID=A0A1Y1YB51_9PLEO|nr:hypothetical protein BCR34DRAFT_200164 [Clohesyomyces aquaticus]
MPESPQLFVRKQPMHMLPCPRLTKLSPATRTKDSNSPSHFHSPNDRGSLHERRAHTSSPPLCPPISPVWRFRLCRSGTRSEC